MLYQLNYRREYGRADRIRTCDPLLPKQMRYQAALRPDLVPTPYLDCSGSDQGERQYSVPRALCYNPPSISLSALSAAPRWLMTFFSAIDNSAIVQPGVAAGRNSGS